MKKLLAIGVLVLMTACSSVKVAEKKNFTDQDIRDWDVTISKVIVEEAYIPDWYGDQNPIYYLQKTGKMREKDFNFLSALSKEKTITEDQKEKFNSLVNKYVSKIDRSFYLKNTNIKNGKGLVDKMVEDSDLRMANPAKYIKESVATEDEWAKIVEYSKKSDLSEKEVNKLRKILNKFIKRSEFFNPQSWYGAEVSERLIQIVKLYEKGDLTKQERNNINAKALYIAYSPYLSELEKWDD